jgi:hypothetical protein
MKQSATFIFRVKFSSTLKIEAAGFSETFIDISSRLPGIASEETVLFISQTSRASNSSVNKRVSKFKLPEMYHLRDVMIYEGKSVNRSQIDIKHKICGIRKKKHLFLDVFFSSINTLVVSLCHCAETRSIEVILTVVSGTSKSPFQLSSSVKYFPPICEPLYVTNTSHHKQQTFIYEDSFH